jgi:hypothetical protein
MKSVGLLCLLAGSTSVLGLIGCQGPPDQTIQTATAEARVGGGTDDCGALDLDCQLNHLDQTQRDQLDRLKSAVNEVSIHVRGYIEGNRLVIQHYDNYFNRWFETHLYRFGDDEFEIYRHVYDNNWIAQVYYARKSHPTRADLNTNWTDYGRAAGFMGVPLTDDLMRRLDAAAGKAAASELAESGFRALKATKMIPAKAGAACTLSCYRYIGEATFVIGAITSALCTLSTRSQLGGFACGLVTAYAVGKGVGIGDCYDTCVECFGKMEERCQGASDGTRGTRGCFHQPFVCRGGQVAIEEVF